MKRLSVYLAAACREASVNLDMITLNHHNRRGNIPRSWKADASISISNKNFELYTIFILQRYETDRSILFFNSFIFYFIFD